MVEETRVTHDNNGRFYRIKMDIAKEGSSLWDLTPYFKGRVGDNRFGLQVTWTYQGRLLDVTGMKPYISGNVGNYSFDDKKELQLADDAATVHYTGSPDDCQSGGRAVYYFPEQMFPREGIFKGYIGLLDDRDDSSQPHISGVTVWFRVLPGIAQMGHACDVYISDLDKALSNFKETLRQHNIDYENQLSNNNTQFQQQLQQVITDARNAYNSQVANSRDAMNALDAEVKANRAELTNINDHLSGVEQQIAIHDIVTIPQHQEDLKNISNAIDERLANIKTAPVAVENATTLQQRYPNGADGIFITADTGHKWLWLSNQWTDCGQYQAIGIGNELIDPIKQQQKVDEENIATNYSLINQNTAQIKENTTDIQSVEGAGALTYVHVTDQSGNRITDQNGNELIAQKWLVVVDKTLTQSDLPADAKAVGDAIKDAVAFKPEEYGIPVLYLYGDQITSLKDKSKTLKDTVTYKFPQYHIQGTLKNFKVQGASSVRYPEKNYTLTFDQDFAAFEDYGRQHKYVIKANWTDFSQAKNVVGAKMWSKVRHLNDVKSVSSIIDDKGNYLLDNDGNHIVGITDPQLAIQGAGAIDGFPIVVYINNQFWGLYTFNIPKDAWMAKMPEKANYAIVSAEAFSPQTEFKAPTNLDDGLSLEFCGTDDSTWVKNSLNKLISVAMENYDTAPAFDAKISSVLDIQSAIDYMVYMLLIDGVDNIDKNYLLQTYDGEKWYFTAYDMDETLGWAWENQLLRPDSDGLNVTLENITNGDNRLYYQIFKFHKNEILQELKDLVAGMMSPENVRLDFAYFVRDINTTLYSEDAKKWGNKPNTSIINYQYIVDWYERRANWIKNKYLADQK